LYITHTSPDGEIATSVAPAHVAAGRRDLVAGLETGQAVLGAHTAELHDWAVGHREVGNATLLNVAREVVIYEAVLTGADEIAADIGFHFVSLVPRDASYRHCS
jgi:hypothetical protein